ncbi:MAG: MarR family transcriptional regulator [Bradyrhizobium sp.]|nr:MAG: MarR family transcriptional regulator [Bradyrhizobium sp.]
MTTDCICSALRVAARKATAIYDEALAPVGINVAQFGLLRKIGRAGTLSLSELGRLAALDRSTIGRNVQVLQRLGLVDIAAGDDLREASVALAKPGRAALRRGKPLWEEAQRSIEARLGGDGGAQLRALLAGL